MSILHSNRSFHPLEFAVDLNHDHLWPNASHASQGEEDDREQENANPLVGILKSKWRQQEDTSEDLRHSKTQSRPLVHSQQARSGRLCSKLEPKGSHQPSWEEGRTDRGRHDSRRPPQCRDSTEQLVENLFFINF